MYIYISLKNVCHADHLHDPDQPSVPRLKWHHPTVGRSHGHAQGGVTAVGADFQDAATSISKPPWVDSINSGHLQKLEICTQRCIQDTWKTNGPDVIQTSRIYLVARFHLYGKPRDGRTPLGQPSIAFCRTVVLCRPATWWLGEGLPGGPFLRLV